MAFRLPVAIVRGRSNHSIPKRNAMFIKEAFAQSAGAGGGDFLVSMLPLILIFVVFYFLLIRPQQQKMKTHRAMIAAVKRGDKVLTAGGIFGTITKVEEAEDIVMLEIAKDVRVRVARSTISDLVNKPGQATPANDTGGSSADGGGKPGLMSQLLGKKKEG
ncbi:MAG: preprotein translocase subunit YajC [Geminicoccaceae bacterium]